MRLGRQISKSDSEIEKEPTKLIEDINASLERMRDLLENNKQEGEGLKIMTPNQLLTRLPILLAPKKQEIKVKNLTMK